jgi:hypothetical protein
VLKLDMATTLPEVFTAREVAQAAGVTETEILNRVQRGQIRTLGDLLPVDGGDQWRGLIPEQEAMRAVRAVRGGELSAAGHAQGIVRLLAPSPAQPRQATVPLLVSTSLHGLVGIVLLVLGSLGMTAADERTDLIEPETKPIRMVYLALPGPGGGGGGGGLKMPTPPKKAERKGPPKAISSPLPARRVPPPVTPPPPKPEPPPPPLEAKTLPPVMAPVATIAADERNQEGLMKEMPKETPPSPGAGSGGGVGTGKGTGLGEGSGSGIGAGEGGGMGGGPYRPGSGVTPPSYGATALWARSECCSDSAQDWTSGPCRPYANGASLPRR